MIKKHRYAKKVLMKPNYYPRYKRIHLMSTIDTLSEEKKSQCHMLNNFYLKSQVKDFVRFVIKKILKFWKLSLI